MISGSRMQAKTQEAVRVLNTLDTDLTQIDAPESISKGGKIFLKKVKFSHRVEISIISVFQY